VKNAKLLDSIAFVGHKNVSGNNRTTLEVTTEDFLTPRGDCIIGVSASKGCAALSAEAKAWLRTDSPVLVRLSVEGIVHEFKAHGSKELTLNDPVSAVIRKSNFTSGRTLAILSDSAARDVPRKIIEYLRECRAGKLELYALSD
jgi:hypothetical protein